MRAFPFRALLLAVLGLAAGCSRTPPASPGVKYRLGEQDGQLTMTLNDKLTLVFEGVAARPGASGSGGAFTVSAVPGAATGGSADINGVSIRHKQADGVVTATVEGVSFKLADNGTKLILGDKTYDLDSEQTVTVPKDGAPPKPPQP